MRSQNRSYFWSCLPSEGDIHWLGLPPASAMGVWVTKCLSRVGAMMGWVTSTDLILPGQWRRLHTYPCFPAIAIALFLCDRLEYRDCIWNVCPLIIKRLEPLLIVEMGKLRHRRGTSAGEGKEPSLEMGAVFNSTLTSNSLLQEPATWKVTDTSHGNADRLTRR